MQNPDKEKEPLTQEVLELFTSPTQLAEFKDAIGEAMVRGTGRTIISEENIKNKEAV